MKDIRIHAGMSYEKKSNLGLSTHLEFFETIYTHFNRNDCFNVKLRFFAKAAQNDSLFVEQIPSPPLIPPLQQSWTQAVKRGSLSRSLFPAPRFQLPAAGSPLPGFYQLQTYSSLRAVLPLSFDVRD
jgi:hypothetical protein